MRTVTGGLDRGGRPADGGQLAGLRSEQRGERHAVDVAAGAGIGRVHVAVRVDPEQAEASALPPGGGGGGGGGAGGQAVIAAEDHGDRARRVRRVGRLEQPAADAGDGADVLLACGAGLNGFPDRRDQVAPIRDRVAEAGDAVAEAGDAQRGRPHVDPAARGPEVEGHADDVHGAHAALRTASAAVRPAARPAATQSAMPTPRKAAPMICSPGVPARRPSISATRAG